MKSDKKEQMFLPLSINITDRKILIVGGGKVAAHKLSTLVKFTSNITILAPDISNEINNDIRFANILKRYERKDLTGYYLVYACTNNREINAEIKKDANELGIMVNVADDPELCDFVSPALFKDNHITVAVGSNAVDVKKAIKIRNWIKDNYERGEIR